MNRLEDELIENLTNEFEIEELIEESTEFELYADEKLVLIEEMLEKQFSDINTEVVTKNKSTESHAVKAGLHFNLFVCRSKCSTPERERERIGSPPLENFCSSTNTK